MMKRLSIIPLAVLAFAPLTRVTAQEPPPVKVGDRVRVTAPGLGVPNRDGILRLLDADSLVMRPEYGGPSRLVIPLASLTRFEVHRGGKSHVGAGAGYGALAGAVIGVGSAAILCSSNGCAEYTGAVYLVLGGGGTLAGLLIGSIVGALIKTDRWEEIPLDCLRVSLGPQRDGRFGLELSVRF